MAECFLGIDLGTSAVKALVVDEAGLLRGMGSAEYPTHHPRPGYAEQDPNDWWTATVAAVRQATGWLPPDLKVAGIGLSGQMHGTVLLGADEKAVTPAVIWSDQRSRRQVETLTQRAGAERIIDLTGSALATGFQAATIAWFIQEKSSLWWRARHVLLPKDELRRRLTGELATDPGDASGTLLLDARWRDWSPAMLDLVGIEQERLPPVTESIAIAGELRAVSADALGLPPGTPVVVGSGDAACGMLGSGTVDSSTVLLSLSTGAQVMIAARGVHPDPCGRTHTFCSALEPTAERTGWYTMGATMAAGMALKWLRDEMLQVPGDDAYDRMTGWAREAAIGAGGLLFLPYLAGERTPHMDSEARGAFLGLATHHSRGDVVRSVLEGITFACLDAYDVLVEQGASPERIVMTGGGARSPFWRQLVADVFDLPVRGLATTNQAAIGAAVLAAVGIRQIDPLAAAGIWAQLGPAVEPSAARNRRYQELHAMFRDAYQAVIGLSHRLGEFERSVHQGAAKPDSAARLMRPR
ncbi:MAG: xylulokinase [Chloroflexia bacterium]|nr:xylulokinase [Chloroflexia bacterium]